MYWNYKSNLSTRFQSTKHDIKRRSNSSFIHHSVSGRKCMDISKTQTKLVLVFFVVCLSLPPLVKYTAYTCAWPIHACFYTRGEHTHGKMSARWGKGRVPTPPWRLLESRKTGLCKLKRGEHGLGAPKQQALRVGTHQSFCFHAPPSFQLAFLTTPVTALHFVYFHKGLG